MGPQLDTAQYHRARQALIGDGSAALIDLIFRLNRRQPFTDAPEAALEEAIALGWVDAGSHALTELGWLVADPIREYRFWLDRDRRIHGEQHHDLLVPERYAGKSVLEPGSGFGCNLLSLSRVPGRFVGLEPVDLYRQMTPIFAEREGLPVPEVVGGRCEALPFKDGEFDIVLCYSAHQYMDVKPALREMARVLKSGGQLQIIGGELDLDRLIAGARQRHPNRGFLSALRPHVMTILNTWSYERLGRRVRIPGGPSATTAPIYPRYPYMRRWIEDSGLRFREDLVRRFGGETCLVADKPGG